jgi:hypothetical protein
MTASRYNLTVPRTDQNGKVWWTKIGVMFPMKDKDGFQLKLEALPLSSLDQNGQIECKVVAWSADEDQKRDAPPSREEQQPEPGDDDDLDDEIPF